MSEAARILAVTTALPPYRCRQQEVAEAAARVFGGDPHLQRLLSVFASAGVEERYFVRPLPYYLEPRGFGDRNDEFIAAASALAEDCLGRALAAAGLGPRHLDHLLVATTTGVATPSLDAILLHRMGLRLDLERTPLFGIGCGAGAVGLARAADFQRARPGAVVAMVAVELCSLTFQTGDLSAKNVIGSALFGDGAACVLVGAGPGPGPRVVAHRSHTFPGSLDIMGWKVSERGLEIVLSQELPALVEREVAGLVSSFLAAHGLKTQDLDYLAVHPGGPRVIDATERALGLGQGSLDRTRRFLATHGNLSSASVLFILADLIAERRPAPGERALLLGFGPGFSAELLLLEW